jgi:hypothetical protein
MPGLQASEFTVPPYDRPVTFSQLARTVALLHGEKILSEIPRTLRRVGQLMLVLAITIPVFFAGLLVVLWHLAK